MPLFTYAQRPHNSCKHWLRVDSAQPEKVIMWVALEKFINQLLAGTLEWIH